MRVESASRQGGFSPAETRFAAQGTRPFMVADAPDEALSESDHERIGSPRGLVLGLVLSAAVWGILALLIF